MTSTASTQAVVIGDVAHHYGSRPVLRGITLELRAGTVGLLGPNGAGKTTLIRVLARSLVPSAGAVQYPAVDGDVDPVGYLPQEPALLWHFTAREFLEYVAWLRRVPARRASAAAQTALESVDLADRADEKIRGLSGGMRQRIGLAASIFNEPKLLLLDEPTNGLDLEQRMHFRQILRRLAPEAITVMSSHLTEDVAPVCDNIVVLREGRLAFCGSLQGCVTCPRMRRDRTSRMSTPPT